MGFKVKKPKGILILLYVFLMMLFPVSLLENFNNNESLKDGIFLLRMAVLTLIIVLFFVAKRKIKIPRAALFFFILIIVVIAVSGITKFAIDTLILISLTIIYHNLSDDNKRYIIKTLCSYFIFFPIFILFLIQVKVLENNFYNDGSLLYKFGFNNPNYFSFTLLFGFLLAYISKNSIKLLLAFIFICLTYPFTKTISVLLISTTLVLTIPLTKLRLLNKLATALILIIMSTLISILVFNPTWLLPTNWENMAAWEYGNNLMSRVHNNAHQLLEIKECGFWLGGVPSKEDNFFVNLWSAIGIIGLIYFLLLSFNAVIKVNSISARGSMFIISLILIALIEQILYSTSLISILYFNYLLIPKKQIHLPEKI
ncbi:hypothetical protein JMN32_26365 [Fulvivirga sp. 29W222]|uniref:O-antigen ligase domain-containing protein n=1 Tax=Fulvivirga marina TaxID=2494733 RepID=A0A937G1D4_9BACT|nr:hypothetical protein [Fulvivirga marina]MBL6449864.1 hypothetical protein [Fulvivirga marina]